MADLLAWAAGLFEGEGTAYFAPEKYSYKGGKHLLKKPYLRPRLEVMNTDILLLAKFRVAVGVGRVRVLHPAGYLPNRKTLYAYRLSGKKRTREVANLLLPYMVSPRKKSQLIALL